MNNTTGVGTVRAYERISVLTEESSRIERDTESIERWANYAREGWPIVHYTDKGISGAKGNRLKERKRLLADLSSGDVLAASKVDRLARNTRDLLDIIKHAERVGADVIFTEQHISTEGPYGKFMIVMLAALAELERDVVAERKGEAYKADLANGRYGSGKLPYWMHAVKHPDKGWLVARPIWDEGPCERCRDKDDRPVIHHAEGSKLRQAILNIISGETFASQARATGITKESLYWIVRNTWLYGLRPDDGAIEDPESAIISKAEWNRLQDRLSPRGKGVYTATPGIGPALFCHHCHTRLYLDTGDGKYKCRMKDLHAEPKTRRPAIKRTIADEYVISEYMKRYGSAPVIEMVPGDDSRQREERLAEISMDLQAATEAMRQPGADITELAQRVQQLQWEREAVESESVQAEPTFRDTGETAADLFEREDDAGKAELIKQHMKVTIHPPDREEGRIEITELQQATPFQVVVTNVPSEMVGRVREHVA